jgi:hypothetical protein
VGGEVGFRESGRTPPNAATGDPVKFDYGDDVNLRSHDASGNLATKPCTVVGITTVDHEEQSRALKATVGSVLYTVEFGDGSDAFVPEDQLEQDLDSAG